MFAQGPTPEDCVPLSWLAEHVPGNRPGRHASYQAVYTWGVKEGLFRVWRVGAGKGHLVCSRSEALAACVVMVSAGRGRRVG